MLNTGSGTLTLVSLPNVQGDGHNGNEFIGTWLARADAALYRAKQPGATRWKRLSEDLLLTTATHSPCRG